MGDLMRFYSVSWFAHPCSRRYGRWEESTRYKNISDDRHYDKWTVWRYEKEGWEEGSMENAEFSVKYLPLGRTLWLIDSRRWPIGGPGESMTYVYFDPDRGSNPGSLRDRRACYCLAHSGGPQGSLRFTFTIKTKSLIRHSIYISPWYFVFQKPRTVIANLSPGSSKMTR